VATLELRFEQRSPKDGSCPAHVLDGLRNGNVIYLQVAQAPHQVKGNPAPDSSNMRVLSVQVAVAGGLDGRPENVFHLAIPELLGGLRRAHQEIWHPAAAREPSRPPLTAGANVEGGQNPALATAARGGEAPQDDLGDHVLVPDPPLGHGLQFSKPDHGDLDGIARGNLPPGHGTERSQ
jgi:hypothetical protein